MARELADYVALALVGEIPDEDAYLSFAGRTDFSGDFEQLRARAEERCGFSVSTELARNAVRTLADCRLIRISEDPYSGTFYKVRASGLKDFFEAAKGELTQAAEDGFEGAKVLTRPSDYPSGAGLAAHEVFDDYFEFGGPWLARALAGLRERIERGELEPHPVLEIGYEAPAADRIVTFAHNQIDELEKSTSEIIEAVESRNEIGDDPTLRNVVLGQLKAGRELVRAGSVRLYIIQITLLDTLKFLARRYEHEAIGTLASALMTALLAYLGIA